MNENNEKTIDECTAKIASNELEHKQESHKQAQLKKTYDELREKSNDLSTDRFRLYKEIERVKSENEAKRAQIKQFQETTGAELATLTDAYNKKADKLDKILKKKLEKEVNIEEMDKDREDVSG